MTTIILGTMVFPDCATSGWSFNGLVDWYTLPDNKMPVTERVQGHGAFGADVSWRSSAAISFTALFIGQSHTNLVKAQEHIAAVGATGPVRMTVIDAVRTTSRMVSVETTKVPDSHGRDTLTFNLDCLARDPRRYSDPVVTETGLPTAGGGLTFPTVFPTDFGPPGNPGRIEMVNLGTAPVAPILHIVGGLGSFELIEIMSGRRLASHRPVPPGSTVALNLRTRRAVIDGQSDITGFLSSPQWWDVSPGATSVVQFNGTHPTGTARLRGSMESGWW